MTRIISSLFLWLVVFCATTVAAELLVFTADWCGPCKAFKTDYANDPTIVGPYVHNTSVFDVNDAAEMAKKYAVKTVPTFLVVDGDTVLRKQEGYDGPANLKKWLENNKRLKR